MNTARSEHAVVTEDHYVIAVGGGGGETSVELFTVSTNTWSTVTFPPLPLLLPLLPPPSLPPLLPPPSPHFVFSFFHINFSLALVLDCFNSSFFSLHRILPFLLSHFQLTPFLSSSPSLPPSLPPSSPSLSPSLPPSLPPSFPSFLPRSLVKRRVSQTVRRRWHRLSLKSIMKQS